MQKPLRNCRLAVFQAMLVVWFNFGPAGHAADTTPASGETKEEQIARGKLVYAQTCVVCHQAQGQGTPGAFPPLAKSDFLAANRDRVIKGLCEGLSGTITVKGVTYNGFMPPAVLNDQQLADVLTFVLNSWDNAGGSVSAGRSKKDPRKNGVQDL